MFISLQPCLLNIILVGVNKCILPSKKTYIVHMENSQDSDLTPSEGNTATKLSDSDDWIILDHIFRELAVPLHMSTSIVSQRLSVLVHPISFFIYRW